MNRRNALQLLAALPFVGLLVPRSWLPEPKWIKLGMVYDPRGMLGERIHFFIDGVEVPQNGSFVFDSGEVIQGEIFVDEKITGGVISFKDVKNGPS